MIACKKTWIAAIAAALLAAWPGSARATATITSTSTQTSTSTRVETTTTVQVSTYTHTAGGTQTEAEKSSQASYLKAMQDAQALIAQGWNLIMIGAMLLNDGTSSNDGEGWWFVITGQQYVADGTRAYNVAKANYEKSTTNTELLTNLNTSIARSTSTSMSSSLSYNVSTVDESDPGGGGSGGTGIKIDPALLRDGLSSKLEDFALKNGIDQDAMSRAMQTGDAVKMVADHLGLGDSQLQKALDNANANPMSHDDMLARASEMGMSLDGQNGLSGEDGSGQSGAGSYSLNGGGYGNGRGLASDGLLGANAGAAGSGGGLLTMKGTKGLGGSGAVSKDIQAAFDRAGISNLTIFQIVHRQYMKKTPMFFGTQMKTAAPQANPFAKSPFEGLDKDLQNQQL